MHAHPIRFLELLNGQVQYVVPRWQRRYRWGQSDIERLVEDLLTVAQADTSAAHYGGTLLSRVRDMRIDNDLTSRFAGVGPAAPHTWFNRSPWQDRHPDLSRTPDCSLAANDSAPKPFRPHRPFAARTPRRLPPASPPRAARLASFGRG